MNQRGSLRYGFWLVSYNSLDWLEIRSSFLHSDGYVKLVKTNDKESRVRLKRWET